ncbi:MAG: hypothetical protein A3E83_02580 [Gammaproteobacteria bacterium RIFCSPHIGHO2_12_FULL_41_20]|nr:MAG: hypothetical protein A3E83_02580 [Gammaproteobacteria bacterium RIFCSPHIGHO2_12_FULL_41_20]
MSIDNYAMQKPGGLIDRLALKKRLQMLQVFLKEFPENTFNQVLDVGVTAEKNSISSNFFEKYFPNKNKIIAFSTQDASFLEKIYTGLIFKMGDVKKSPFRDGEIDIVFSSAVIEHVGSLNNQKQMLAECYRIAKKGVFITTPNRWYPVDLHTILPLIHWLPKKLHRIILKMIGLPFYSTEKNLNLLDENNLRHFCKELNIQNFTVKKITTFGFVSNLMLIIKK